MNKFSLTSLRIEPYVFVPIDGEIHKTPISCATGFLYRRNEQIYLITNWHVVSGLDVNTHDYLDKKHSAMPTHLKITPSIKLKDEEGDGVHIHMGELMLSCRYIILRIIHYG